MKKIFLLILFFSSTLSYAQEVVSLFPENTLTETSTTAQIETTPRQIISEIYSTSTTAEVTGLKTSSLTTTEQKVDRDKGDVLYRLIPSLTNLSALSQNPVIRT